MTWFSVIVLIIFVGAYFYREGKEAGRQEQWERSRPAPERSAEVPGE